jgi:hypothetical protein
MLTSVARSSPYCHRPEPRLILKVRDFDCVPTTAKLGHLLAQRPRRDDDPGRDRLELRGWNLLDLIRWQEVEQRLAGHRTMNRFQKWTSALKGMARRWRATGKAIATSPITGRHVNL